LSKLARLIANCCSVFYNFDGVRRFKGKFAPSWWESEYIVMSQSVTAPPRILRALVQAIVPAGPSVLIARQINRAWHRMSAGAPAPARSDNEPRSYEMQSVAVNGLKLNYVSAGTGRPVVLIHGNPGSHEDFTVSLFDKLSQSYHAIAFDRPGHGHSERPDSL